MMVRMEREREGGSVYVSEMGCLIFTLGVGGGKPGEHQLSGGRQVGSVHPQTELLLPDPTGPQQSQLPGTHTHTHSYKHTAGVEYLMRLTSVLLQVAMRCGVSSDKVKNVIIWGNHSSTQYPDVHHAKVDVNGAETDAYDAVKDEAWLRGDFISVSAP